MLGCRQSTRSFPGLDINGGVGKTKPVTNADQFLRYYRHAVARTTRLVPLIPPALIEWRPAADAFSFGGLLRHLAGIEHWMWTENVQGRPARYPGHDASLAPGYDATLAYVDRCRRESLDAFAALKDDDLARAVTTPAGAQLPLWKWLRAMLEHEAHHRGQLYVMLRMNGVETPPLFGLTSEDVKRAGES